MNKIKEALLKVSAALFETEAEAQAQLRKAAARRAASARVRSDAVVASPADADYKFDDRTFYCTTSAWIPPTTSALFRPVDTTASFDTANGNFTT